MSAGALRFGGAGAADLADVLTVQLETPAMRDLVGRLEALRWTGRPGYPIRSLVAMCLIRKVTSLRWTQVVRLAECESALREVVGAVPSHWACYRFARLLSELGGVL